jgi:septal ring factor EnvC (AmiA/AmiB activator)
MTRVVDRETEGRKFQYLILALALIALACCAGLEVQFHRFQLQVRQIALTQAKLNAVEAQRSQAQAKFNALENQQSQAQAKFDVLETQRARSVDVRERYRAAVRPRASNSTHSGASQLLRVHIHRFISARRDDSGNPLGRIGYPSAMEF